jgi:hypothetical protein
VVYYLVILLIQYLLFKAWSCVAVISVSVSAFRYPLDRHRNVQLNLIIINYYLIIIHYYLCIYYYMIIKHEINIII